MFLNKLTLKTKESTVVVWREDEKVTTDTSMISYEEIEEESSQQTTEMNVSVDD